MALALRGSASCSFLRLYPPINIISMPSIHFVFSSAEGAMRRRLTPPSQTTRKDRAAVSALTKEDGRISGTKVLQNLKLVVLKQYGT